jgi:hypothetical protein
MAGSVGAVLYGLNPEVDIVKSAGKLAQTRSPAVVRRFEFAGRGLIILLGLIVAWKLAFPALVDATHLLVRNAPVQRVRCIVKENQRGLFGLWFLSQSLTVSGESYNCQTLYLIYSARFVRPGKKYCLCVAPKSKLVLDVQDLPKE